MVVYRHSSDMGEISGFGGGYEQCCQNMLDAGVRFLLEDRPELDPRFKSNSQIYGIVLEDNDDAKELTKIVIDAANGDATGAQHHAVIMRCLAIKKHGWEWYCTECRKHRE